MIGIPTADVSISAPTFANAASATGAPGELTLFFKLYDLKPDGTIVPTHRLISPVRIADFTHQVHVELPGIVHRFSKGDRIALTIAARDAAYRGTNVVGPVTINVNPAHADVLRLPTVAPSQQTPVTVSPLAPSIGTPAARNSAGCAAAGKLVLRPRPSRGARVTSVAVYINGKLVKRVHGRNVTRVVILSAPRGVYPLTTVVTTDRHSRQINVARYRGCQKLRSGRRVQHANNRTLRFAG